MAATDTRPARPARPSWHLELAHVPGVEMYYGGWTGDEELRQLELGERVMDHETDWLFTRLYSKPRDRMWAAVGGMYRMVLQAMRDAGKDPATEPAPAGWHPDAEAWDEGRLP
jgi:hypothetical protein